MLQNDWMLRQNRHNGHDTYRPDDVNIGGHEGSSAVSVACKGAKSRVDARVSEGRSRASLVARRGPSQQQRPAKDKREQIRHEEDWNESECDDMGTS
jgi:hypothetical protein